MTDPPPQPLALEDRLEVHELYARQAHAIDSGDAAGWAGTYVADGVFASPTFQLVATGTAALEEFARTSYGRARDRGDQLRHHLDTVVMTGDTGSLIVDAYLVILATSAEGSRIDRSLTVQDTLTRTADGWRMRSRTVFRDDAGLTR